MLSKFFIDVNSNIDSLERAIDRFINIEMDLLVASDTFSDADLNECLTIASELQGLLALNQEELASPKIIELKNKKIKSLKTIMSKFDWQSTDAFIGKNQLEIENMKQVFLAAYQLLVELEKIDNLENKEGKVEWMSIIWLGGIVNQSFVQTLQLRESESILSVLNKFYQPQPLSYLV